MNHVTRRTRKPLHTDVLSSIYVLRTISGVWHGDRTVSIDAHHIQLICERLPHV